MDVEKVHILHSEVATQSICYSYFGFSVLFSHLSLPSMYFSIGKYMQESLKKCELLWHHSVS